MFSSRLRNRSPIHFMAQESDQIPDSIGYRLSGYWLIKTGVFAGPVEFDIHIEEAYVPDSFTKTWGSTLFDYTGQTISASFEKDAETDLHKFNPLAWEAEFTKGYGLQVIQPGEIKGNVGRHNLREVSMAPTRLLGCMRFVPAARGLIRQVYELGDSLIDDPYVSYALPSYLDRTPMKWLDGDDGQSEISKQSTGLGGQEEDAVTAMAYSRKVMDQVSHWTQEVTGVGFRADNFPPKAVMPVSETPVGDIKLIGEGFGTNALLQLLLELARADEGATILMEEPKIHLHPKAQAELTSVIVEEAKASNKQVIMTTHSEHIANRLLTLVAEREISPEEVAIYSFEKDDGGVCSASEIEVTPRGQVKAGLKSFFEAHMEEMRRYGDALRAQI